MFKREVAAHRVEFTASNIPQDGVAADAPLAAQARQAGGAQIAAGREQFRDLAHVRQIDIAVGIAQKNVAANAIQQDVARTLDSNIATDLPRLNIGENRSDDALDSRNTQPQVATAISDNNCIIFLLQHRNGAIRLNANLLPLPGLHRQIACKLFNNHSRIFAADGKSLLGHRKIPFCWTMWKSSLSAPTVFLSTQRFEQQVAFFGSDATFGDHAQNGLALFFRVDLGG